MADRVIKLILKGDNADLISDIEEVSGGLEDLDKRAAKDAKKALDNIDKTTLSGIKAQIKSVGETLQTVGGKIKSFGSNIQSLGASLTVGLTAPILAIATFGIVSQANLEKAEVSFTRFIKNTKGFSGSLNDAKDEAKNLMNQLIDFADKTPFESEEVIASGRTLLAAKIPREEIKGFLQDAGDLAAGANTSIEEVSRAMSRIKSGDFGEAFERLRDFGISKEDLVDQGLDFTKGGQFTGNAEEAMKAVRAIIQERFAGTMDDLSQTLSGRFSTLLDKGKAFFRELFQPAFEYAKPALDFIIEKIEFVTSYLQTLSPQAKLVIVTILAGIAALGPVLTIVGTVIVGIGAVVSAIGTISAALAGVSLTPIILGIAAAVAYVIAIFVAAGAAAYVLYKAWENNFGGIRDFTNEVWNGIKNYIQTVINEISAFIESTLNEIEAFWEEDGESIMQAVNTVYSTIANIVKTWLDGIRKFWEKNGQAITSIVKAAWEIIRVIFATGVSVILDVIALVAAVINGDWKKVWEIAKNIIYTVINAIGAILQNLWKIVKNVFLIVWNTVVEAGTNLWNKAKEIGANIIKGLMEGLNSLKDTLLSTAKAIILAPINIMKSVAGIQSPSKITTYFGEMIGEGLAVGMLKKLSKLKTTAKTIAKAILDELKSAIKKFNELAGLSSDQVNAKILTDKINQAASDLQEIIKLRGELGVNLSQNLPSTAEGTAEEIELLRGLKQLAEEISRDFEDQARAKEDHLKRYQDLLQGIKQAGDSNLINLQEELQMIRVVDPIEKSRVKNHFDLLRLREQLKNDGFSEEEIENAIKLKKVENERLLTQEKLNEKRRQVKEAEDFGFDLQRELEGLRGVNQELTVYQETLQKLETIYKDISPAQKEYLLQIAQQIDAQKQFNQTVEVLNDVLTKAVNGNWKGIFDSIFNELKRFLIRAASEWLASKFWKLLTGEALSGSGSGGGGGNILGGLFGGLFGGGTSGGTPPFNPGNFGGINFGGGLSHTATHATGASGGAGGGGGGGIGLTGIFSGIGIGANILGGLIGGKAGSVLSAVGSGIATGAALGSIIPGIGTVVGAVIGGAIGFFSSIFGSKKRKIDKQENLPKLQQGLGEAMKQLRELAADKNAIFNDPEGAIAKARDIRTQIAGGFGIQFQSKKYRQIAQQRIDSSLAEADRLIEDMKTMKDRAVAAKRIDEDLNANFAGGVYLSPEFRRRNGMLAGAFTGRDTLPSMLANGEMVLNPSQIARVRENAGFDAFRGAGIPGYAGGSAIAPTATPGSFGRQPVILQPKITISMTGNGISDVQITDVVIDGLKNNDEFKVELVEAYDKTKARTR